MEVVDPAHPDSAVRPAASKAEARAAQWCAARLSASGYDVEVDAFPARTSIAPWLALDLAISTAGALLVGVLPLLAFGFGLVGIVLYARDTEGRASLAPRRATSHNVVGMTSQSPRVVVFAGLDGIQGWSAWHAALGQGLRYATLAVHFILVAVPAISAGIWIFGTHDAARAEILGGLIAAVLSAVCVWICSHDLPASGDDRDIPVQVALRVGELRLPDVWIVFGGASGAGNEGIQALLRERGESLGAASILNLEQMGTGPVAAAEQEGVLKARRAFGGLVQAAEDAGAEIRDWRDTPTDGGVALAHHFKALTLLLAPGDEADAADRLFAVVRTIVGSHRGMD
ncbi:MAG: hypothetical protein QOF16_522 [Actinomycetota bacterium]|nr:hypothetical protein [Actinomycetota bacterium]